MSYYSNLRKKRIQAIHDHVKSEEPIERGKVEANAAVEFGVTKETAGEMVSMLLEAGKIIETDNGLTSNVSE